MSERKQKMKTCGCLDPDVNARVVYSNLPGEHIQHVYAIQHDQNNNRYVGHTFDKRTHSRAMVFANNNYGPYYEHWVWQERLKQEQKNRMEEKE